MHFLFCKWNETNQSTHTGMLTRLMSEAHKQSIGQASKFSDIESSDFSTKGLWATQDNLIHRSYEVWYLPKSNSSPLTCSDVIASFMRSFQLCPDVYLPTTWWIWGFQYTHIAVISANWIQHVTSINDMVIFSFLSSQTYLFYKLC